MKLQPQPQTTLPEVCHMVLRLLVSSYFIGMATGVISYEPGHALMKMLLPDRVAELGYVALLVTGAFLVLVNHGARAAALLLSLFVFWSGFMASFGVDGTRSVAEFWRDLTLIAAVMMTYAIPAPDGARRSGRAWIRRKVTPRRITPRPGPAAGHAPRPVQIDRVRVRRAAADEDTEDEVNIFAPVAKSA